MITKFGGRIVAAVLLLASITAACGKSSPSTGLSGTVSGDGSSTVFPITEAIAEEFRGTNEDVKVTVGVSGTGGGFERFCDGETDIQDASRPIKDEEKAACTAKGVSYVELTVASDGLAVTVNKENTWADCLTSAELKTIWQPKSKVKTWRDVRASFPAEPIKLFGPGSDSGTFDFFTKEINGEEDASRSDYTASEDDNTLVKGVAGAKGGLGYFGYAYYAENQDKLKVLGLDSGSGCVVPSDATVRDGSYTPLARPLLLYVKAASAKRPEVKAFIDFYLENVNALVGDVGYTALDDAALASEVAEWEAVPV